MENEQHTQAARKKQASNSTALIALGIALFVMAGVITSANPDGGATGAILFGLLGVGLVVAGIVVRPRN